MSECKCSIDVDSDCSAPGFFNSRDRKARIEHKCDECSRTIAPKETYRYVTGMWEGDISSHKICVDCTSLRETFFCSSVFGSLWDDFEAEALENDGRFGQECINLLTPTAKRKVLDIIKEIRRDLHEVMDE